MKKKDEKKNNILNDKNHLEKKSFTKKSIIFKI